MYALHDHKEVSCDEKPTMNLVKKSVLFFDPHNIYMSQRFRPLFFAADFPCSLKQLPQTHILIRIFLHDLHPNEAIVFHCVVHSTLLYCVVLCGVCRVCVMFRVWLM